MQVSEQGGAAHVNSFERCSPGCAHQLNVKIGLGGGLELSDPGDPPLVLRFGQTNSQTGSLDCNANGPGDFSTETGDGCIPFYKVNQGTSCPASLDGVPQPWDCAQLSPGNRTPQGAQGLNERILGAANPPNACPPAGEFGHNNWPNYESGDPRIVLLFITRFGSFDDPGASHTIPITGFAAFYITGWQGTGASSNPCQSDGDDPTQPGEIVGHFIAHVKTPNDGGAGSNPCDFDGTTPCIPVLVE
jgi:hypothetical protein